MAARLELEDESILQPEVARRHAELRGQQRPDAPVQGDVQTCEEQTCLGSASLEFEPSVAYERSFSLSQLRSAAVVSPGDPRHKASSERELRRAHVRGVVPEGWGSRTYQSARLKGERWPLSAIGSI